MIYKLSKRVFRSAYIKCTDWHKLIEKLQLSIQVYELIEVRKWRTSKVIAITCLNVIRLED